MLRRNDFFTLFFAIVCCVINGQSAWANEPLSGCFVAEQECPAYVSIKKKSNPGDVMVQPGDEFRVTGQNKPAPTYYLIQMEGVTSPKRWVSVSCGKINTECGGTTPTPEDGNAAKEYLLAVSWQAAFCQTHKEKAECKSQTPDRFDAINFSLHGLWPQPQNNAYCGVSDTVKAIDRNKRWHLLPETMVNADTRTDMEKLMPGVASNLDRHEWIKHGTCYQATPEEYFSESLMLIEQINNSPVRELFANNIGQSISAEEIRNKFDEAFGEGAGAKVNVKCDGKLITEFWVNLKGEITANSQLADLMLSAPSAGLSCREGRVDQAGF
jgi:ribonuclease T2